MIEVSEEVFDEFTKGMEREAVGFADCTLYYIERAGDGWPVTLARYNWPYYGEKVGRFHIVEELT